MITVPRVPQIQVAFALTIAGIACITCTKNVPVKRVVAPITMVLFSYVWLESFREVTAAPPWVVAIFALILAVNGMKTYRKIRYCAHCGATLPENRWRRRFCKECASAVAHRRSSTDASVSSRP